MSDAARVVAHFARTRGLEVAVLQASPLLGAWLGGIGLGAAGVRDLTLLLLGSAALTAHVFARTGSARRRPSPRRSTT